jgi:hypothetical protein
VTLFRYHDVGAIARVKRVYGIRGEGSLRVGQAPIKSDADGA